MQTLFNESQLLKAVRSSLRQAQHFRIAMALITRGGLREIRNHLEASLARRASGEILFGLDMSTEPEAVRSLLDLQSAYPNTLTVKRFHSPSGYIFHPKLWVFRLRTGRSISVIGSSNLTYGGLLRNYEANVLIDAPHAVSEVINLFDELFLGARAKQIDEEWLASYGDIYKERRRMEDALRRARERIRKIDKAKSLNDVVPKRIPTHSFAFTGWIRGWKRELELYPEVRRLGGKVVRRFSGIKNAECLVEGDLRERKTTRKLREADRLGIPRIDQDRFLTLLKRERRMKSRSSKTR